MASTVVKPKPVPEIQTKRRTLSTAIDEFAKDSQQKWLTPQEIILVHDKFTRIFHKPCDIKELFDYVESLIGI